MRARNNHRRKLIDHSKYDDLSWFWVAMMVVLFIMLLGCSAQLVKLS